LKVDILPLIANEIVFPNGFIRKSLIRDSFPSARWVLLDAWVFLDRGFLSFNPFGRPAFFSSRSGSNGTTWSMWKVARYHVFPSASCPLRKHCANTAQTCLRSVYADRLAKPLPRKRCSNVAQTLRKPCANLAQTLRKQSVNIKAIAQTLRKQSVNHAQTLRN
jgi:hypothetical protein